jgi:hypothetical protein
MKKGKGYRERRGGGRDEVGKGDIEEEGEGLQRK